MILRSISLTNYRNFQEYSIDLGKKTTMLIVRLKDEHINAVVEMVRASRVISERHKRLYFY